ncbi:hypothetical protein [uncultured Maribacter sp.]|uniref:hypothetical protein n=1 Tax=uncultured Maribacter sp. TaxID=431308 RepID=UPI0026379E7F|nr:hypothetical protein [uncultured Maribacter sp.]
MQSQKIYTKLLLTISLFVMVMNLHSQDLGVKTDNTMIAVPTSGITTTGSLNFTTPCSNFIVQNGKVWVKLDLGQQYNFGSGTVGIPFDITVNLDVILETTGAVNPTINFDLNLDNQKPEGLVYLDLNQYIDDTNVATGLSYLTETLNAVTVVVNSAVDSNTAIDLQTNLEISLNYELQYGLDVSNNLVSLVGSTSVTDSKEVSFEWLDTCDAPNYEFQLLRLYNKDAAKITDEQNITTNLDWSKALSFQTYSSEKQISLTIGEGQGFYVWRVRPLGTFYENGAGNSKNWGAWNTSMYDASDYSFVVPTGTNEAFFFTDPDDNTNYQYSRVFTEGNKISEQATYATTLNQVKQTQRYFPSKDYKIISQTILDNSGRPTLTTLPVPLEGERINKYKSNLVTTNGELYRAKHFDDALNYTQPAVIDATGAFGYYSSLNVDKRIPDAEGYPYTRVIFSNDGTDRVVEQSGVGKTHMIGSQASNQGRTVRTLYGTPTEEELVSLFGDEAPDPESTAKVITIDPNNTKSVAYITKEGNTIATGLTFSEDDSVLDNIDTVSSSVSGVNDKISNNIKTEKGFKASKRITILEDATEVNISYSITKPVLEGLCNNLEIELDYELRIEIFDVETGEVVKEFYRESIADSLLDPLDEQITIDFGAVTLDTGSYYIQKSLVPSNNITGKLVTSQENTKKLIEPYFAWLVSALDEIDCEEEMEYLYHDIFFYGQKIYQQQLAQNNGLLEFNCEGCSDISYQFNRKDSADPEAPAEFLDFYEGNESLYSVTIVFVDDAGEFVPLDYGSTTSLGDIVPVEVRFSTPCCDFDIPIAFTPPFKKPSTEAMEAYIDDPVAVDQVNTATNYYSPSSNLINPNTFFLTQTEENFLYEDDGNGNITIINRNAYPLDFEGYAISMLYQCKSTVDPTYLITDAENDIYNAMRGWHKPGLLNQMVYHMATDSYGSVGCANRIDGSDSRDILANTGDPLPPPIDGYHVCDGAEAPVRINNAQYSVQELAECWEPLVIELVNRICIEPFQADIDQSSNVSDNVDDQEEEGASVDDIAESIDSWIIRLISRAKIKRKLKKQKAGTTDNIADEVEKQNGSLVKTFLECTGYAFADILDPDETDQTSEFSEFSTDFDGSPGNGEYDRERLSNGGQGENWSYFSIDPDVSAGTYVTPPSDPEIETANILKEIFPYLQDPVYAFKYYGYESGTFPDLEVQTCYRDPNICYDINGNEVPCCGGTVEDPVPCNFCGLGYITCPYTKKDWSCDQRFTFYDMIKNYKETVEPEAGVVINCENYYEDTEYVINPDYGILLNEDQSNTGDFQLQYTNSDITLDALVDLKYLSKGLVDTYLVNTFSSLQSNGVVELKDINGDVQTSGVSLIENDAYAMQQECAGDCDERRSEFREQLIKAFVDRCYEIGECKITANDNIVPLADIELMVDQIVEQCKSQCAITSFACTDEPCRLPTRSPLEFGGSPATSNDFNISYIDFGVSGPVVTGLSNRENQTLKVIDPNNASIVDTGEVTIIENISTTGTFEKYDYNSNPSIWDIRRSLTYAEYSRWIQAKEWDIVLDIPSKCDANGNYNTSLTYDVDGFPIEAVYVMNEDEEWVVQDFSQCESPYVTRDNPTGPGDTFVERDKYIKTNTTPISPNDPSFTTPVESPKVGIEVKIDQN